METLTKTSGRIYYLDLIRVIACLSVVMVHTTSIYVTNSFGSFNFWVGTLLNSLARIGVPLFVMVSGALMLDENYAFSKQKLANHIKRMIIFFVFWSAFYCLIFDVGANVFRRQPLHAYEVFLAFVKGYVHLWFVPMIIGLYLIVPLLRLWVTDKNKKYVEYFLLLSFLFTFLLPQIVEIGSCYSRAFEWLDSIVGSLMLKYVGGFTLYFILGWYLRRYEVTHRTALYLLGVIGAAMSLFGTYLLSATTGEAIQMCNNIGINVLFQAAAVFVFVKAKRPDARSNGSRWIRVIARHSLGIYAIHMVVVKLMNRLLSGMPYAIVKICIVYLCSFTIAFLGAVVFSKIPVLKKVV